MNIGFDFLKNPKNKQKILVGVLAAVLLFTAFVLYSYFFKGQSFIPVSEAGVTVPPTLTEENKLNTEILQNPLFQSLKKFGEYPIKVEESELGKQNPFVPY